MIKQQAFIMPFENMFTHQTNILIFAHHPEAEPRGILLIKEYTNLKEGDYIMKVKVKNSYGVQSEPAKLYFTISPPWYRHILY